MQDRYAGDIGDFSKYGLLRWLCGMRKVDDFPQLRLGIIWYLFDGVETNAQNDGRFIQYLFNPLRAERSLQDCDPYLYDKLQRMAAAVWRSVADVPISRVLPPYTLYYDAPLNFDHTPQRAREGLRRTWMEDGLAAVADAEIVCVDPDNGMETPSAGRLSTKGPKFVYYDDLQRCWERGQSLVIYQHTTRSGNLGAQVAQRCKEMRARLPGANPVALRFRRRSSRVYFVAAQSRHANVLNARLRSFLESDWGKGSTPHFELIEC